MKLCDVLAGIPLTGASATLDMEINSISYDTRTLQPGALFVALPGAKEDGGNYLNQAMERGAAAVLCQQAPHGPGPWLETPDCRLALALASANWFGHPGDGMTLIGVTGTNGKTTTTVLIQEMLQRVLGTRVGLIGTIENRIGDRSLPAHRTTPESYEIQGLLREMAKEGCTHVVMEVSSHGLVQHRVGGLRFAAGVFTNLTQDHLDYHHTMEEYRAAKARLFDQCEQAVLNLDDEAGRWYRQRLSIPVFTYSERRDEADLTAKNLRLFSSHVEFEGVCRGEISRIHLPIPGGFSVYNGLAALACGRCLGLGLEEMAGALRSARGVKGRVEVVPTPTAYTVLIDYAHSPNALENVLVTARDFTAGRLICVFGCGGDRDRSKRALMGGVVRELADVAVLTSDNPRTENPWSIVQDIVAGMGGQGRTVHIEPDRITAIRWALAQGRPGDVIVLAGKGHETYQEIQGERIPLDEREVVAEFFRNRPDFGKRTGNFPAALV